MELYKVSSKGKEYIGTVISIDSDIEYGRTVAGDLVHSVLWYTVKIIPKDNPDIIIDNIIIHSLEDIKPYEE